MNNAKCTPRSREDRPVFRPRQQTKPGRKISGLGRSLFAAFVSVTVVSWIGLPVFALADLAEDIAVSLEEALNGMNGTEITATMVFDISGIEIETVLEGFAFCTPTDPTAEPDPDPTPPYNAYGCENGAMVQVTLAPDESSAELLIEVSEFFLDFRTSRDTSFLCGEFGPGTVEGTGYFLSNGTVDATLQLYEENSCVQVSLVPASLGITIETIDGFFTDDCLAFFWNSYSSLFFDQIVNNMVGPFEEVLAIALEQVNDSLCDETPAESVSWSAMKAIYW